MFGGQIGVPMVLRTQGGTGRSAAAQHSQSLEAWMLHTPGLRLVMPGTVNPSNERYFAAWYADGTLAAAELETLTAALQEALSP